jgi:hypothetical protein
MIRELGDGCVDDRKARFDEKPNRGAAEKGGGDDLENEQPCE